MRIYRYTALALIMHDVREWSDFFEEVGKQARQRARVSLHRFTRHPS